MVDDFKSRGGSPWGSPPGDGNGSGRRGPMPPDIEEIIKISEYYKIEWMFSILSEDAFSRIRPFNPKRYKVASRTVIDKPDLVQAIVNEGRETFISLGMWEKENTPNFTGSNIRYIWCKSLYPTPPWELLKMPKDFLSSPYSGFSDHSIGIEASLLAISRGAQVIEKHFTLDKSDTTIRDHALSLTPKEFARLVENGRQLEKLLNLGV